MMPCKSGRERVSCLCPFLIFFLMTMQREEEEGRPMLSLN
jgi:hypothetical protein